MLMHNFLVTNEEYYGMLWFLLQWSIKDIETDYISDWEHRELSVIYTKGFVSKSTNEIFVTYIFLSKMFLQDETVHTEDRQRDKL